MKKIILGSMLLLACASASAQVIMGSGLKPWYVVHGTTTGADVADLDGVIKKSGMMRMQGAHYFAQTVSFKVGQGKDVQTKTTDYIVNIKDYNCGTVGSVRMREQSYYLMGNPTPIHATGIQYDAPFKIELPSSAGGREWAAVCKNNRAKDFAPVSIFLPGIQYNFTHESVLKQIRQQIEANKKQASVPAPTPQPVR